MLDALVSAGLMEMLLAVIEDNASSSTDSGAAESGLALLLLADLAAGSERAKVRGRHKRDNPRNGCAYKVSLGVTRFPGLIVLRCAQSSEHR